MSNILVRPVAHSDVPWLLDQLRTFDAFFNTKYSLLPSEAAAHVMLTDWIDHPEQYPFWVAVHHDTPVGFIAGVMHPHFYQRSLTCFTELLWWVVPEYRSTSAAYTLLAQFVTYGRAHAQWITMVLGTRTPVKSTTLQRMGFQLRETKFLLEV